MRLSDHLNARQWDVLRRIASGPPVTSTDSSLAKTVYACGNRKLVTTRRIPRQGWTAEITETGQYLVDHGHPPSSHPASHPAARSAPARPPTASPLAVTVDDVFARLAASNGRITIEILPTMSGQGGGEPSTPPATTPAYPSTGSSGFVAGTVATS